MENETGYEKFCGGPFWDYNLTWYTDHPDFTACFQRTVVVWVPCGFLLVLTPFYILYLTTLKSVLSVNKSRLNSAKVVLSVCLSALSLLLLVRGIAELIHNKHEAHGVFIVSPATLLISFIISSILTRVERWKSVITSPFQFLFYLLLVIAGIVPFHSYIYSAIKGIVFQDNFSVGLLFLCYALIVVQFILFCFAERLPVPQQSPAATTDRELCPEVTASFLSQITFWWMNGLVLMGFRKSLEEQDIWLQNPRYLIRNTAPQLDNAWTEETKKCKRKVEFQLAEQNTNSHSASDEREPLLSSRRIADMRPKSAASQQTKPSFLRVLAKVYGLTLFKAQLCKLLCDLLLFVGPLLQKKLIIYTEGQEEVWKGYFYAALFFCQSVVYSIFFHQLFHIGITLGMRIKAAVITLVYKKALTISNQSRRNVTVGEIVNLMSVDAQRLQDITAYLWMTWSAPIQISIAMYMLYNLLGVSVLAGLGVMLVLLPFNAVITRFVKKLQTQQMLLKDQRIKLMNEVLNGIKVLKLYAWETSFQEKVNDIRTKELNTLKKCAYLNAFMTLTWSCAPVLVTIATFATYTLSGGILDASRAFTALSLFNILRFPLALLPTMIVYLATASVSIKRVGEFLAADDIDKDNVLRDVHSAAPVVIEQGTFGWGTKEEDPVVLKNINFQVANGMLMAVVGQVGVGKSSLLSSILGEMEKLSGRVTVEGTIAYVAQQAWIQNATVRDNILFGKPYDEHRYNLALDACALRADLQILPAGDATEIGEKGINLSGGQKQRVSMARAVYQDCDIYLLDDPLSAVDSHVGKHIFENIISKERGLLRNKTRILVTHDVRWLPAVDKITVLVDGAISETGSYDELMSHNRDFAQFLRTYHQQDESNSDDEELMSINQELERLDEQLEVEKVSTVKSPALLQRSVSSYGAAEASSAMASRTRRQSSSVSSTAATKLIKHTDDALAKPPVDRIIEEEAFATGKVPMSVYVSYCKSMGLLMSLLVVSLFSLFQVCSIWSSVWLSQWTNDPLLRNTSLSNTSQFKHQQNFYLGIYGAFGGAQSILIVIYAIVFALATIRSSGFLHRGMLSNILRSPMLFFETTPIGRILNRFSRDIETVDNALPSIINGWITQLFAVTSTVIIISYSTPIFLSVVLPLLCLYYIIQRFYIPTTRQLKRIESTTRSPIYVNFSETITGSSTIRAYQQQQRFMDLSEHLVDHNLVFYFATIASNRWIGFRLEFLGSLVILSAAIFAVLSRGSISGGIVGLSLSYALQVTQSLNWLVRSATDLETNIVSVERIIEYSNLPSEADWHVCPLSPPDYWPSKGQISFRNYATRYRPGLDLVLNNVNVDIQSGEKVGIVGRTGAGKSSMTLALFRMIEGVQGTITIDGFEISELALYPLRSKLVILPQDPVLFSGSLRMNLDPFEKFSDSQIWRALEHAHLKDFVQTLPTALEHECGEGGQNLSVGQRQLVCLARALLRKTKILVLDEATAAVDLETDELIQKTIRQEFADCTVLTIAHRLNTIMDSNRVMVLDAGKVHEFDSPENLLANKNSLFYKLAKDAGLV